MKPTGGGGIEEPPAAPVSELYRGAGGNGERTPPGATPREEGGSGMRELGTPLPEGRGTTLTGLGAMPPGRDEGAASAVCVLTLESFSSPMERSFAGRRPTPRKDSNPKGGYWRTIS